MQKNTWQAYDIDIVQHVITGELMYLHSALLCRKVLHSSGKWLSFHMDSSMDRMCLNSGLSYNTITTASLKHQHFQQSISDKLNSSKTL